MSEFRFGRDHVNDFDLDSPEFNAHHDDVMALLGKCPIAHSRTGTGYTIVTKYDDIKAAAMDWRTFSSQDGFWPNRPEDQQWFQLIESDPPFHTAWRKLLGPFFNRPTAEQLAPTIRKIVNTSLDAVLHKGSTDFIEEIAGPLPVEIFFRELLPLPDEDFDRVVGYASDGFVGPVDGRSQAWASLADYVDGYLKQRRNEPPRGDMIDAIIAGPDFADPEPYVHGMNPDEVRVSVITNLISGSVDNIVYTLGCIFHHLAENPADRELLVRNPQKIPNAIEEAVRFFSPNPMIGRTCKGHTEIGGHELEPDDYVMLAWGAANRDPSAFQDPDRLDFERSDVNKHVAFGHGPHRCIGIDLARVQLRVAIGEILARMPEFELADGTSPTYVCGLVHEMRGLHLTFPCGGGRRA